MKHDDCEVELRPIWGGAWNKKSRPCAAVLCKKHQVLLRWVNTRQTQELIDMGTEIGEEFYVPHRLREEYNRKYPTKQVRS